MTPRQALVSALHLFVVGAFFAGGLFCVALPYLPGLRVYAADLVLSRPDLCTLIGLGLFGACLLLLLSFYSLSGGRYLRIVMGRHLAEIDAKIIRETVEDCFRQKFADQIALQELEVLWGRNIEINAALKVSQGEEELLARAEKELTEVLRLRFGYNKPFSITLRSSNE